MNHVHEEEQRDLERCEEEITARIIRVAWLEQVEADILQDGNLWRSGLVSLPVWKKKGKKHAAKRKGSNPAPSSAKKRKLDEESLEKYSSVRRDRLLSESDEEDSSRKVHCVLDKERFRTREPRSKSTPSRSLTPL